MQVVTRSTLVFVSALALILGTGVGVIAKEVGYNGWWGGIITFAVICVGGLRSPLRRWRVQRRPFPNEWHTWLAEYVPLYAGLPSSEQQHFQRDVQFFLDEQTFEAVGDVATDVLDSVRVAAGAALMLHGRPDWEWPRTRSILFYPTPFDDSYYDSVDAEFDGMVHAQGPIILYIDAVRESWEPSRKGSNVVLHELAHVLDFQHGMATGTPRLINPNSHAEWERLVNQEMRRIRSGNSLLRPYAATNTAEFFAVAVELFFERPHALQRQHEALYQALVAFFNLDPVAMQES